jgi:hypothetical protein
LLEAAMNYLEIGPSFREFGSSVSPAATAPAKMLIGINAVSSFNS